MEVTNYLLSGMILQVGESSNWVGLISFLHLSNEKRPPGCLVYIGDEILPSYIGILINHCKDPYEPTSLMESRRIFFRGSVEPTRIFNITMRGLE